LPPIVGYRKGAEFDGPIQFWLDYWKNRGVSFPGDLEPLMIKAMIAVESSFNPRIITKIKGSTAAGLMQVTDQALRIMGGFPNKEKWIEMKSNLIHVEKSDKLDPLINIALGIRLLGHKFSQIPKGWEKTAKNAIRSYYSRGAGGKEYAEKVLELYEKSRKK
jgi:soluble lytic murein transglycosylase-like protein